MTTAKESKPHLNRIDQAIDELVDWYDDFLAGRKPARLRLRRTVRALRPAVRSGRLDADVVRLLDHSSDPLSSSAMATLERVRQAIERDLAATEAPLSATLSTGGRSAKAARCNQPETRAIRRGDMS